MKSHYEALKKKEKKGRFLFKNILFAKLITRFTKNYCPSDFSVEGFFINVFLRCADPINLALLWYLVEDKFKRLKDLGGYFVLFAKKILKFFTGK
jgi:hypothetical protein